MSVEGICPFFWYRVCRSKIRDFVKAFHRTIYVSTEVAKGNAEEGSPPRGVNAGRSDWTCMA